MLEYLIPSSSKRFYHFIKLAKYNYAIELSPLSESDVKQLAEEVMLKNKDYFKDLVSNDQLVKFITLVSSESRSTLKKSQTEKTPQTAKSVSKQRSTQEKPIVLEDDNYDAFWST